MNKDRFYFKEARLSMTLPGRILVRITSYVSYIVFLVGGLTLAYSDVPRLKSLGILILFFFADRILRIRQGDEPFSEMPKGDKPVNLADYISPAAYSVIEKSFDKSAISGTDFFLEAAKELLDRKEIKEGLARLDLKPEEVAQKINSLLPPDGERTDKKTAMKMAETLVVEASMRSIANNRQFIETSDLFSGLASVGDAKTGRIFNTFSIDASDLEMALLLSSLKRKFLKFSLPSSLEGFAFETQRGMRRRTVNRAWTSRPTPVLDSFSSDFTEVARHGGLGFIIGHEKEYQRLVDTLSRPINPNALLVGETGVGKETIVAHLARQIIKDDVPSALFDKRLIALEINNLVAGASPEELQDRLRKIVDEILMAGNVILYVPDFHNLVKTSGNYYLSAADALAPVLKGNAFPVVGATYPREFKEFVEPRSDIASLFETIMVNEIDEPTAQKILVYDSLLLEKKTGIIVSFGAIKSAVALAKKYLTDKFLPSSAEELLKGAMIIAGREGKRYLTRDEVVKAAEEKVNVPIHEAGKEEAESLLNLEETIHERLVGQDEAVKAVGNALREYRSGLSRPGGPIATFLFVGPTGVGKTELAKILSRIQFGSESAMIRFDMTEYQSKDSFYRFIGTPDGKTSGELTEAVLRKPYCLILLDEFEKAFPDILNLFLQVFDDGRLTDNLGRTVGFQNTIIIATSNAHSDIINDSLSKGEKMEDIAEYLKRKLTDVFRPELLNRFSRVVVFRDLSPKEVDAIARINLGDLADTVGAQGIKMDFDESAVGQIVKIGYDPAFGARPLRRAIEENLRSPLAEKLLKKEISRGDNVRVFFRDGTFTFETSK